VLYELMKIIYSLSKISKYASGDELSKCDIINLDGIRIPSYHFEFFWK